MGESHHATDDPGVLGGPAIIADLNPGVFILHLHHPLSHRQSPAGHGDHRPQTHLLHLPLIHLHLDNRHIVLDQLNLLRCVQHFHMNLVYFAKS